VPIKAVKSVSWRTFYEKQVICGQAETPEDLRKAKTISLQQLPFYNFLTERKPEIKTKKPQDAGMLARIRTGRYEQMIQMMINPSCELLR